MADIKIQRGSLALAAAAATGTITAGVDYVAPSSASKAFIRVTAVQNWTRGSAGGDFDAPDRNSAWITNPANILTSITFQRYDNASALAIAWEIWEYTGEDAGPNEFLVRHKEVIDYNGPAAALNFDTGTVSGVVTPSKVVPLVTSMAAYITANRAEGGPYQFTSEYISGSTLSRFTRGDSSEGTTISTETIEFTGSNWSIQRVTHTRSGTGVETTAISTVVMANTFILPQMNTTAGLGGATEHSWNAWLSDVDEISSDKAAMTGTDNFVFWVISNSALSVQRVSNTRAANTGGDPDTWTETISAVASLDTAFLGAITGQSTSGSDLIPLMYDARLTALNTVTLSRGRDIGDRVYRFEVVSLPAGAVTEPSIDDVTGRTVDVDMPTGLAAGTLYGIISTSATVPTEAQIATGNDHTGSAAVASDSDDSPSAGSNILSFSGLTPNTTYYFHGVQDQDDLGDYSNIVSLSFTTVNIGIVSDEIQNAGTTLLTSLTDLNLVLYDAFGGTELVQASNATINSSGIFSYAAPSTQDLGDTGFGILQIDADEYMPFTYTIVDRDA